MSANMDKGLYAAPQGLDSLTEEAPLEIEVVDPEALRVSIGGEDILSLEKGKKKNDFNKNLAEDIDETVLATLASELLGDYEADIAARKDWLIAYVEGLKVLGLKYDERTEPWPGACGVTHPLLMESAVKFQSETIMETFPAGGPVRTKIIGKETPEKKDAAQRVEADMNYELTEVMKEYRPEHERLLISVALSGNAFKKIYFDPSLNRQTAVFIPAEDIVVPYGASSLESAERVTHRMRKTKNDLRKLQYAEFYRDVDLGDPIRVMDDVEKQKATEQGFSASMDDRFQILEMHVDLDLEGYEDKVDGKETGIALPYIVTIEKGTQTVLAIRRNWLEDDELKLKRQHFTHYGYIPGFGFYYFGLIHLIGGHSKAATSLLRQLIDAGTLANLPGGLKARGLRIKGDDTPIAPGEFRDVDLPSGAIRDNILPLPYKEPSQTLAALMDKVVEDARRFAATADLQVSDMSAQAPVGTTLAILERALKVMSAVQARIHYTMKQEFKLLAAIIRDNTPESYDYEPETGNKSAKKSDYDQVEVIPVSDPNASTMSQRVVQYQAVHQLAQTAPQVYDLPYLHRQMIEVLGVKNASKIVPMKDDMKPVDPVTENMNIMMGKPVKAFLEQDHEAHIGVHMAAMQDPKIMQMMGQNPQAQALMAAASAHLMEHVAFQYRKEIEKQLGASLPPMPKDGEDAQPLPPEVEAQIARLSAQAAAQLLQKDQAEAKAQQAAQQAQDPLLQMQQMELQIKQAEVERKKQKDMFDALLKAYDLNNKEEAAQHRLELDGARLGVDIKRAEAELSQRDQSEKQRHLMDLFKQITQISHESEMHESEKGHASAMQSNQQMHDAFMQNAAQSNKQEGTEE